MSWRRRTSSLSRLRCSFLFSFVLLLGVGKIQRESRNWVSVCWTIPVYNISDIPLLGTESVSRSIFTCRSLLLALSFMSRDVLVQRTIAKNADVTFVHSSRPQARCITNFCLIRDFPASALHAASSSPTSWCWVEGCNSPYLLETMYKICGLSCAKYMIQHTIKAPRVLVVHVVCFVDYAHASFETR